MMTGVMEYYTILYYTILYYTVHDDDDMMTGVIMSTVTTCQFRWRGQQQNESINTTNCIHGMYLQRMAY